MDRNSSDRYLVGTATASEDGDAADAPATSLLARGAILGRYLIVDTVGVGGTGIVYSAFDPDLDRKVALKLLRKSHGQAARSRLLREAQAMAKLSHPNVVTVFEVGTDGQRDFVAMEFVDGQDLAGWIATPHDSSEVLDVYRQAGEGLAAAHRAGLVHRDFKPQNVLIDGNNRVLVTDFGLARHSASDEAPRDAEVSAPELAALTRTGALLGTPAYMAPEQHLAGDADPRSDQFSFCVALFEALSGRRPYDAENYEELREAVTSGEAAALPDSVAVPATVRAALAKGMSRDPVERHDSMEALLQQLAPRPRPRRLAPIILAFAVVTMLLGGLGIRMLATDDGPRCQFDRTMLTGAWDEPIRGQVASSFANTGVEGSEQVFSRFESIVDAYADDIVSMRKNVCESSRGRRGEADELLVLRMSCLQRRRQELAALTSAFSSVDPRGVDRVIEAAQTLRPVSDCRDVQALQRGVPGPPAAFREDVEELQASLEDARLEGEAGHVKSAIARAEAANARSLVIGYLPLQAESYESLGHLYRRELRMKDAERAYEEAILAAEESGYTEYRARALVGMTQLLATGSSRYDDARRFARRAKAAIAQGGGDLDLAADVDLSMASILVQEGDLGEALALLEPTLRQYRAQPNAKALYIARLQNRIAGIRIERGEYEEAYGLAKSSYEQIRAELGDSHPRTAAYLSTLSITHRMRGEHREARKLDKELRAYWASEKASSLLREDDDFSAKFRVVRGRVLGDDSTPVEGATVVCAQRVVADARYIDAVWSARRDAVERYSLARSAADGSFRCQRASQEEIVVVAEHAHLGRSAVRTVAAGATEQTGIELRLAATGFLSGQVTRDGHPGQAQSVSAVPVGEQMARPPFAAVTFLRADGSYSFERLAPGRYKVFSGPRSSTASQVLHSQEVEISSGRGGQLDFDQSEGDAGLSVRVSGRGGASVPSAQVLVVPGHIESQSGREFNQAAVMAGFDVLSHFWSAGAPLELSELQSGAHSLCVVALAGDYRDPEYMSKFTKEQLDRIPVHCQDIELVSDQTLEVEVEVPPLAPMVELDTESKTRER